MPSDPAIFRRAAEFRASLLRAERAAAMRMVRAYADSHNRILAQLELLMETMRTAQAAGETVNSGWYYRQRRYQQLLAVTEFEMTKFVGRLQGLGTKWIHDRVGDALDHARILVETGLDHLSPDDRTAIIGTWGFAHPEAVEMALGFLDPRSPIWGPMEGLPEAMRDRIEAVAMAGIAEGYNPREWARKLRDVTGEGLDWSLRWARTLQLNTYREATRRAYIENQEIVKGWIWWAEIGSSRTCPACVMMHGTVHPLSEPLNDHHNGRCAELPLLRSFAEMGISIEGDPFAWETGIDWFEWQTEGTQVGILGPGKFDAWRQGLFQLPDIVTTYKDSVWGDMRHEAALKDLVPPGPAIVITP